MRRLTVRFADKRSLVKMPSIMDGKQLELSLLLKIFFFKVSLIPAMAFSAPHSFSAIFSNEAGLEFSFSYRGKFVLLLHIHLHRCIDKIPRYSHRWHLHHRLRQKHCTHQRLKVNGMGNISMLYRYI